MMGTQANTPLVVDDSLDPVTLRPGQTVYVQYSYSRRQVKINDSYFDALKIDFNNLNAQNVNSVENYAGWLKMTASDLPKGVDITLMNAFVGKYVSKTNNTTRYTEVSYYPQTRVVLKITATSDAQLSSTEFATLTFTEGANSSRVPLVLTTIDVKAQASD